jgi:nucleoside-diphosphate-sugar epimerase
MKKAFIAGGGGFIGGHLTDHLLKQGYNVISVDIKPFEQWYKFFDIAENHSANLEIKENCIQLTKGCDVIYNLACNMGGMGFIENNKALCMLSVLINTHLLMAAKEHCIQDFFYSSTACVYQEHKQSSPDAIPLSEEDVYPAMPEDGYGWEKLFSERMCRHFSEDFGIRTRVARLHNIYGPHGTYRGGREKAPAAICRKVIQAKLSGNHKIEIWGDGKQSRSFMYIDDCIAGIDKLMQSDFYEPINLGSSELVTIDQLVDIVEDIAEIKLKRIYNIEAPQGVRGRSSDNTLIKKVLGWEPSIPLKTGMNNTYDWIFKQMTIEQTSQS